MNYICIAPAAAGCFVANFILGGLMFGLLPLKGEFVKYPEVVPAGAARLMSVAYRSKVIPESADREIREKLIHLAA